MTDKKVEPKLPVMWLVVVSHRLQPNNTYVAYVTYDDEQGAARQAGFLVAEGYIVRMDKYEVGVKLDIPEATGTGADDEQGD